MIITAPLRVLVSKKKWFVFNLNVYRNSHFQALNKAKKLYKEELKQQITLLPSLTKIQVDYYLYPKTKRRTDLGNVLSIHQKFFEDALVELGIIPDDDYKHIIKSTQNFGELDKDNPRVEIEITEITDANHY